MSDEKVTEALREIAGAVRAQNDLVVQQLEILREQAQVVQRATGAQQKLMIGLIAATLVLVFVAAVVFGYLYL